jgi:hypothetical protein
MASAGSLPLRLPTQRPPKASTGGFLERLLVAGLFLYMALAVAHYPVLAIWSRAWTALLIGVGISAMWWMHLEMVGLRRGWGMAAASILLLLLAGPWLRETENLRAWLGTLGCGLFVYAMIWVYAKHEREPGLQPLATAALVLSIGVVAKPAVVAGCACLSLAVFIDERRHVGGWWRSLLLLLTPILLCAGLLGILNSLWAGGLVNQMWDTSVPDVGARLWSLTGLAGEGHLLCFPLALLASQLLEGKTRKTSLAYLFLIVFTGVVGTATWMPHPLGLADFTMVVAAGGCSLLALDPPRHWFCRLLALAGMGLGVGPHAGLLG